MSINTKEYQFFVGGEDGQVETYKAECTKWNENSITIVSVPDSILQKFTIEDILKHYDVDALIEAIVEREGILQVLEKIDGIDPDTVRNWAVDKFSSEE